MTSTIYFSGDKKNVVQFVADIVVTLPNDSLSITVTSRAKSVACSVSVVTTKSLEGIVVGKAMKYSLQLIIT